VVSRFNEERGLVSIDSKMGFIDCNGKTIIPPLYSRLESFSEGLAMFVSDNEKFGFIDKNGNTAIRPIFDDILYIFNEGLAAVKLGNRWGYVDGNGNIVIAPNYYRAGCFENGIATVWFNEECSGYINKFGRKIWPHV
jgi:hypothetical protein